MNLPRVTHAHFVGIGGVGMAGIAEVLLREGHKISGSDLLESETTQRLRTLGATIYIGHEAKQITSAHVVVTSTAVSEDNPEVKAAHAASIPVMARADMLAELMRFREGIAIAGTHGKTTTTSLIATLFSKAGLDPTFVIGGRLNSLGANAQLGAGTHLIAEADESDASFLKLFPKVAVVTNIDADHLEVYQGDFDRLKQAFLDFLHRLPSDGLAVLCVDDPGVKSLLPAVERPVLTYGFSDEADFQIIDLKKTGSTQCFTVLVKRDNISFSVRLNMPGSHNVLNALAGVVVAYEQGVPVDIIETAWQTFEGVGRRFNVYDNCQIKGKSVTLIDDYGHHPKELAVTLDTVKATWPNQRLLWVFQPHRYTRTRDLFDDFCDVLARVPHLILCEVYSAGESFIAGADGASLCQAVGKKTATQPLFAKNISDAKNVLENSVKEGDIVLLQGAGDIAQLVGWLCQAEKKESA